MVGHEPFLSEMVSRLLTGSVAPVIALKKGGLCKLTVESFKPVCRATLEWLLTPGQLAKIA